MVIAGGAALYRRRKPAGVDAWVTARKKLGGQGAFVIEKIGGWTAYISFRVPVGKVEVSVKPVASLRWGYDTLLEADTTEATTLSLVVRPKTSKLRFFPTLGLKETSLEDRSFDQGFTVFSNDEGLSRVWLNDKVRERIARVERYSFTVSASKVTAKSPKFEDDADRLVAAARAVAALARAERDMLWRIRRFARALGGRVSGKGRVWKPDGTTVIKLDRGARSVRVDYIGKSNAEGRGNGLVTRIRSEVVAAETERFRLQRTSWKGVRDDLERASDVPRGLDEAFVLYSDDLERTDRRLTSVLRQALVDLGPEVIGSDGSRGTVLLAGVVLDESIIRDAIDLTAGLTSPEAAGPYR